MIPSLEPTVLHFKGLIQTGTGFYTRCDQCKTWAVCNAYRVKYTEGLGVRLRLCPECVEAME